MEVIKDKTFSHERALYNTHNVIVEHCTFAGEEDGESFLKESSDVTVKDCFMDLRYPMWHVDNLKMYDCNLTVNCRAALWYDNGVYIQKCVMNGIKALRESSGITLKDVQVDSPEFAWRCKDVEVIDSKINSQYAFFESTDIKIDGLEFEGKYSFQYTHNLTIDNSTLNTKDAFWHAQNVTVRNSNLNGEYLGWYSDGLTLIDCHIKGTQPFCYCKNLTLVNCTMQDCDLAFEYSQVQADVIGEVLSVKNPLCGKIVADSFGEIIFKDSKYKTQAEILVRK